MPASSPETLSGLLDKIQRKIDADKCSRSARLALDDILEIIGRRAYGPLLVIVGSLSISPLSMIPGTTWLFAAITLLIAVQMAINRKQLWLPRKALDMEFPESKIAGALKRVRPWTRFVDRIVRPRLQFLAHEPWLAIIAFTVIAAALITFPLSFIPFAPFLPGVAIVLIGLGVTAKDGVVLAIATALVAGAGWVLLQSVL